MFTDIIKGQTPFGAFLKAMPAAATGSAVLVAVFTLVGFAAEQPARAAELELSEQRNHVDFARVEEERDARRPAGREEVGSENGETAEKTESADELPKVTWIRRSWREAGTFGMAPLEEPGETIRSEELLLIEKGKIRYIFRQETEFSEGTTLASLRIIFGPDDTDVLSARYEIPKVRGLMAWMKKIRDGRKRGGNEPGWIEATIGGRIFYYPEDAWTEGALHPEDLTLLEEAVDERLRNALEELDGLTRAGYVAYAPYLIDMLVFPVLHPGEKINISDYTNQKTAAKTMLFYVSTPNCAFDATFGEECPEKLYSPPLRTGETQGTELAVGGTPGT